MEKLDILMVANPLRKFIGNNKDRKKPRKLQTFRKDIKLSNIMKEKEENINIETGEPFKYESKKEKGETKRRKSRKSLIKSIQYKEKKEEIIEIVNKNKKEKEQDINELPYSKAILLDNRNSFHIYFSFLIEKLELINVFYTDNRLKIILFIEYILSLLINFFFNALLYSDDVVSHKYHNNGKLDFAVSLALSIISNLVTSLLCHYLNYSRGINENIDYILETKRNIHYYKNIKKFELFLKYKFLCFWISETIVIATCIYYIEIFGVKYYYSQISLLLNYCYSFIESIITSFIIAFAILATRKIGLSCHKKEFYVTSQYINNKT